MGGYEVMIHPYADVHHTVLLGDGCQIWSGAVILEGTSLGKGCTVANGCFIGRRCQIGDATRLHPGAAVPDHTCIGHHVFVGAHVVLTDVAVPHLQDKTQEVHRPPVIEDYVVLGSNSVILPGIIVHAGAIVGAGAVVTRDVPPGCTVKGNPARISHHPAWDTPLCNEAGDVVTAEE